MVGLNNKVDVSETCLTYKTNDVHCPLVLSKPCEGRICEFYETKDIEGYRDTFAIFPDQKSLFLERVNLKALRSA